MKRKRQPMSKNTKLALKKQKRLRRETFMTQNLNPHKAEDDDMLPEYDLKELKDGVRGKYYQAYRAGHMVQIQKIDGLTETHFFALEDGAVMLDPDLLEYFPDSTAVNNALRSLVDLTSP
jgi:hypothetical protein